MFYTSREKEKLNQQDESITQILILTWYFIPSLNWLIKIILHESNKIPFANDNCFMIKCPFPWWLKSHYMEHFISVNRIHITERNISEYKYSCLPIIWTDTEKRVNEIQTCSTIPTRVANACMKHLKCRKCRLT